MLGKPDEKSSPRRFKHVPEWLRRRHLDVAPMSKAQIAAYEAAKARDDAERELHRDDPIPF